MYYDDQMMFHGFIPRIMGTRLDLLTCGTDREIIEPVWDDIKIGMERLDGMLDRFKPSSEVSLCNAGLKSPGDELKGMIRLCEEYKEHTSGFFDITKGSGTELDFGGFAKGYALRMIRDRLLAADVSAAFVDFGQSSMLAIGGHPLGGDWKVSLTDPYTGRQIKEISLRDSALSVSGNTPGYSGHIVDPHSGEALTARRMVSVISPDPLDAEVLSTALMLIPEKEYVSVLSSFEGAEAERFELK